MASPSGRRAIQRSDELCMVEHTSARQSSSRGAPETEPVRAPGVFAGQPGDPSGGVGHDRNRAGEAQAALDVEAAFGPFLDEFVAATIRLSDAQRQIDRRGAWRRSLSALGERLWRLESKSARSQK